MTKTKHAVMLSIAKLHFSSVSLLRFLSHMHTLYCTWHPCGKSLMGRKWSIVTPHCNVWPRFFTSPFNLPEGGTTIGLSRSADPLSLVLNIHINFFQVCVPFAAIIAYIYAIVYFGMFRDMFDNEKMEYCDSLGACLITVLKNSLRPSAGGHNYRYYC